MWRNTEGKRKINEILIELERNKDIEIENKHKTV